MRNTKTAFTLVELIVVITILAVLGTIAFISLQGYSGEARDSKRLSNVNAIVKKVNIEVSKGTNLQDFMATSGSNVTTSSFSGKINNKDESIYQGSVNFLTLKENQADFMDNDGAQDYPFSYSIGGSGTGAYKFMQIATVSEALNNAVVVGNYYEIDPLNDIASLITKNSDGSTFITQGGTDLPY